MYVIGLTGGIASGKSTVSAALRELGAPVIDADRIARAVVDPGQPVCRAVLARFGPSVRAADGGLDRAALGELIFRDAAARRRLEAIMHPPIKARVMEELADCRRLGAAAAVLDAPLLYEAAWQYLPDEIWVVYVEENVQLRRLMERNRLTAAQAEARIRSQMSLAAKAARADYVIDNNGTREETRRQAAERWRLVLRRAGVTA